MSMVDDKSRSLSLPEKLALAQDAFEKYKTQCFWFMREDFKVTEDTLHLVINGLRSDGDRQAFLIAARLCQ